MILLFIIIYSSNIYEGFNGKGGGLSDPWALHKKRQKDLEEGKVKRNGKIGYKDVFEIDSHKLFDLFDKNKNKVISKKELLDEESDFDNKFIDEYISELEKKDHINFHEFKEWHEKIIGFNKDEYIVCPQKEKDKPMDLRIHIKIFDMNLDVFDDVLIKGSKKQNELIESIQEFTMKTFLKNRNLNKKDYDTFIPKSEFLIEPKIIVESDVDSEKDSVNKDILKRKYISSGSNAPVFNYTIKNIQKQEYEFIRKFISLKHKTISFKINNKTNTYKDFILKVELMGLSHMYQKNKKGKYNSYDLDNHCEWKDNHNDILFQHYNSSCKPDAKSDDPCWNKSIPLQLSEHPKLLNPTDPYIDYKEHKPILSYPLHSYPEHYIKQRLKKKYDDHSRENIDRPTVFLFDLIDEYNDISNERLYKDHFR
tara:strand:- start:215 stop:1483 length:1269 start_codon:yes stop_codon:yes gene_type:complete